MTKTNLVIYPLFRWSKIANKMVEIPSSIYYSLDKDTEYYVLLDDEKGYYKLPKNEELTSRDLGRYEQIHKAFTGYGFFKVIREI